MIGFASPWLLWGLVAAAIPVLLHLFARREPPVVVFPAVRYLTDTARLHQRRLTIQHLLLLILRTVLIALLVVAAAGPTWPSASAGGHAPTALVLVLDNSLSSAATDGGTPVLDRLREAAREVLGRAEPGDAVWLLSADAVIRSGRPAELRRTLDSLPALPRRLDLGDAVATARELLASDRRPGEVVVITDLQATALSDLPTFRLSDRSAALTVARPPTDAVPNAGVAAILTGPQPWTAGRAAVSIELSGNPAAPVPVSVSLGARAVRQALGTRDAPVAVNVPVGPAGWSLLAVELAADELRADDRVEVAIRVAPPAQVRWDPSDRFVAAAAEVLRDGGRIQAGDDVSLGLIGRGPSVVLPPDDPARVGAVNRALASRGVPWRYGPRLAHTGVSDSGSLLGPIRIRVRQSLEPVGSGETGVLIRAGAAPWVVRSGSVVVMGSRLDTAWTELPLAASFLPFLDALLNRVVRGELALLTGPPGDPVALPDGVDAVILDSRRWSVEGGARFRPVSLGTHFLLAGSDTIGSLSVNPDPRESDLTRASPRAVQALWPGVRLLALDDVAEAAFRAAGRADLRPPLLWLGLVLLGLEAMLAGWRKR